MSLCDLECSICNLPILNSIKIAIILVGHIWSKEEVKKIEKGRQVHIRIGTSLELGSFSTPALKIFVEVPNGATRLKVNPGQTKIAHFLN